MTQFRKLLAATTVALGAAGAAHAAPAGPVKNVVLVHGAFVDGSGWADVYKILTADGYKVTVVQNQTASLADDVAITRRALAAQDGPAILVGHSYGGIVISDAGNDAKVKGLVYVAAFAPEAGESVASLGANPAPGAPVPPILPPQDGFSIIDKAKFHAAFAADVSPQVAAFMADSQTPFGVPAITGSVSEPAWKVKPSWYVVADADKMIPPAVQRAQAARAGAKVTEAHGSHAIFVSQPKAVAAVIEQAAQAVGK